MISISKLTTASKCRGDQLFREFTFYTSNSCFKSETGIFQKLYLHILLLLLSSLYLKSGVRLAPILVVAFCFPFITDPVSLPSPPPISSIPYPSPSFSKICVYLPSPLPLSSMHSPQLVLFCEFPSPCHHPHKPLHPNIKSCLIGLLFGINVYKQFIYCMDGQNTLTACNKPAKICKAITNTFNPKQLLHIFLFLKL